MAEFGPTSLFDSEMEYNTYDYLNYSLCASEMEYNDYNNQNWTDIENFKILDNPNSTNSIPFNVILFTICFLGLLGNGKVIWILGFHMKRNSFSIYVLNLAVADSGVLIFQVLTQILQVLGEGIFMFFSIPSFVFYNASQFLLISISVDRCTSVLFPIWHQCRRPSKLSLIVCIITWVLPLVWCVFEVIIGFSNFLLKFGNILFVLISYPVVVISTLILLVKIFITKHRQKRKKVLTVTLLALMCFIVLRLPVTIHSIIVYITIAKHNLAGLYIEFLCKWLYANELTDDRFLYLTYRLLPLFQSTIIIKMVSDICIVVNSSINPILYFLAGRNKEDRSRISMKLALRRVFRNEEDITEDEMQPDETPL